MKHMASAKTSSWGRLFPALGNVAIVSLLHCSKLAELPQCRRMSWRRRDPGRRETRAAARGFPLLLWTKNDFAQDLKKAAEKLAS